MRLTQRLGKLICNLNKPYWNRRIWEIGYRGRPIPSTRSDKPPSPVNEKDVVILRQRLLREYNVMQWLATPYLNKEQEKPYVDKFGTVIDEWRNQTIAKKQAKMPNKSKFYKADGTLEKCQANVGNLLHNHRTVEDSLKELIRRSRWD